MKTTANFVIETDRAQITLDTDRDYVSFTGRFDGSSGQCQDSFRLVENEDLQTVLRAWDSLHLQPVPVDGTPEHSLFLSARLALLALNGTRIPGNSEGGNADDFEDAEFSNSDDIIDSRDIISRIEYLTDFLADVPDATPETYDADEDPRGNRGDAVDELARLRDLESAGSNYAADWEYGTTLIRDSYFEDYARELADDIGAVDRDAKWPNNHIDWESAAAELKQDYTSIDFDGVTYWVR